MCNVSFLRGVKLTLGVAAGLTLVVRALGLLSQRVILGGLGASAALDGYFIALILPALVVTPVATALETALSPAYGRLLDRGDGSAERLALRILWRSALGAGALAVLSFLFIEPLVVLSSPAASEAQRAAAETAARWVFPVMAAQIIGAGCRSVLYGRGRFQVPIAIGALNPLAMLAMLLSRGDFGVEAIAQASAVGFIAEAAVLLVLVRDLARTGQGSSGAIDVGIDLVPLLLAQVFMRSIFYVDQAFASGLDEGSLTHYSVSLRLYDAAAAILVLPNARIASVRVAKAIGSQLREQVRVEMLRAFKVGLIGMIALGLGAPVMIRLVLQNGEFTGADVTATIGVSAVFAVVLLSASVAHVGSRSIVAVGERRVIPRLGFFELIGNVGLNFLLAPLLGAAGIALSTGIVYAWLALAQRRVLMRAPPTELDREE